MRIQIPRTHVEAGVVVCICNREAETGETGKSLELTGQPAKPKKASRRFNESPCFEKNKLKKPQMTSRR